MAQCRICMEWGICLGILGILNRCIIDKYGERGITETEINEKPYDYYSVLSGDKVLCFHDKEFMFEVSMADVIIDTKAHSK